MKKKMKRIAIALMSAVILFVAVSCGSDEGSKKTKGAFEMSKEAYDAISVAYETADNMASDIYEAWRQSIYEGDDLTIWGLSSKTYISYDDLEAGINSYLKDTWLEKYSSDIGRIADMDSGFSYIIHMVIEGYELNGNLENAKVSIDNAKSIMKEMSAEYSDYEHYPALKGYFTSVNSLLSWCESPEGSFEQAKTTINDYRNEIRDYQQDLDYIFED